MRTSPAPYLQRRACFAAGEPKNTADSWKMIRIVHLICARCLWCLLCRRMLDSNRFCDAAWAFSLRTMFMNCFVCVCLKKELFCLLLSRVLPASQIQFRQSKQSGLITLLNREWDGFNGRKPGSENWNRLSSNISTRVANPFTPTNSANLVYITQKYRFGTFSKMESNKFLHLFCKYFDSCIRKHLDIFHSIIPHIFPHYLPNQRENYRKPHEHIVLFDLSAQSRDRQTLFWQHFECSMHYCLRSM